MKFEIIHDTIAKQVFEKASTEARTRRKVEKFIRERYEAHQLRGTALTTDDLDYIQPYLHQVNIDEEESAFIEKARKSLVAKRNRIRAIVAGVIIFLLGSTAFSVVQWQNAIEQKGVADKQTIKAKEAQQADSIKAIELGIALKAAQAARDTAEIARIKAEQEKLRADTQAKEALRQKNQAQKSAAETKSLALASIAKNLPQNELEKSLRILQTAYLKTFPSPPPATVSLSLTEKFYQQIAQHKFKVDDFEMELNEVGIQPGFPLAIHFDHVGEIKGYDLSPDETHLLTYGEDSLIKVWTLRGDLLLTFDKHQDDITSARFSQDGTFILSSSFDETSKLWDLKGKIYADMSMVEDRERLRNRLHNASFSPSGNHILTQVKDSLKLWDLKGNKIADIYGDWPKMAEDFILTELGSQLSTWDYEGKNLAQFDGHASKIHRSYLSPDGSSILSISTEGTIKHWDKNGEVHFTQHMQPDSLRTKRSYEISASYSKGGEYLLLQLGQAQKAIRSSPPLSLSHYKLLKKDGTEIKRFSSHHASFTDRPNFLLSLTLKKGELQIEYIDPNGETEQHNFSNEHINPSLNLLKLSPDKQTVFLSDLDAQIFRVNPFPAYGKTEHEFQKFKIPDGVLYHEYLLGTSEEQDFHAFLKMNIGPNYLHLYDNSGNLIAEDLNGGFLQFTRSGGLLTQEWNKLRLFYPRGILLHNESPFMGENRKHISEELLMNLKEEYQLSEIIPNEKRAIIYGKSSDSWMVWDDAGALISKIPAKEFTSRSIDFFEKGDYFLFQGNFETDVLLWDYRHDSFHRLQHSEHLESASISPDEQHIISFEKDGGQWKLWNRRGRLVFEKKLETQKIGDIHFSPDNSSILIRDYDRKVSLWNLRGKRIIQLGPFPSFVRSAVFSPDGKEILVNYSKEVLTYNLSGEKIRSRSYDQEVYFARYTQEGNYTWLALENGQILIQNKAGRQIGQLEGERPFFSPQEQMVLTRVKDSDTEKLWDLYGKLLDEFEYPRKFMGFSPDGNSYAVAADGDQHIQLFNKSAELIAEIPYSFDQQFKGFSDDGQFVLTQKWGTEITQYWPLPPRIFQFLQEEARFPQLSKEDKKYYRIE